MAAPISLLAFAFVEYDRRGWDMPDVHVRIYEWLERTEGNRSRVLQVFRGVGKSTILGIRNAWRYRQNPGHQLLVQGADDDLADDISRDTLSIMRGNPLMPPELLVEPAGIRHWFTRDGLETNARTPQFRGRGILSRVTGNRADEIINDDTEMSKNVESEEARKKLRKRLSEQSFILKPGGAVLWVGTPHTHDSIYDQKIKAGADALVIPLFATQDRHEPTDTRDTLTFKGDPADTWVFEGIGEQAKLLAPGVDYTVNGQTIKLRRPTSALIDICTGNAWPERFTRVEMAARRRECETINYWDQQYQLQAKPLTAARLDPDRLQPYDCEPVIRRANGATLMTLGDVRIVGAVLRWDPSSGKVNSDVSAVVVLLQDDFGRRYLHRVERLLGDIAEFDDDGKTIIGGQVHQLCNLVEAFSLPRITVETNGIGAFAPATLKAALKQRRLLCGVKEEQATQSKNRRILEAMEPLLMASDQLWAHVSVMDGPLPKQMRDWNPAVQQQPDDYVDVVAGAVTEQPERVGRISAEISTPTERDDWRPSAGVYEVEIA